ncbi:toll/interleukin-1 receptor domain-containing protein [Pseudonocardia sp. NPDC049154]|uniref:toll/interleukin-1 receptor domain-containing protein n=1 Tax=Pseudonocardia sp. NPDC049154 TaxID=3155501 RepID=UPI0033E58F12
MSGIFLSYRREDTRHMAGRLADRLTGRFTAVQVFMDVDTIEPGMDFARAIAEAVETCDVLLALIGPRWLGVDARSGRPRLHDPSDYVSLEIRFALERDVRVIPVLIDGADMPEATELPRRLQPLVNRNAVRLDHETFASDVGSLQEAVARILREPQPTRAASEVGDTVRGPRVGRRIALWWAAVFCGLMVATSLGLIANGGASGLGATTGLVGLFAVLGALAVRGLVREIRHQRQRVAAAGGNWRESGPLATQRVWTVAVLCVLALLALGLSMALTPPVQPVRAAAALLVTWPP